ncbi:DUF7524 family protein [Natronococcus wangiae]|uniref:DUF7524 family protein n=1 Tax=Natronococcus wangiae TaxID=3068275 RepID=UPI00273F445C|nr:hypothetical protein [Natronococcus sp. AD5]
MSTPTVTVHVNRGSPETLEPAVGTFETAEPFTLILEGHDSPAHVHCRLDGTLAGVASLPGSNYYVEPDAQTPVPIEVNADAIEEPVDGTLEVLTGYGAESVSIRVTVEPAPSSVEVDESLAKPNRSPSEPSAPPLLERLEAASGAQPATIAVLALGFVAVAIAAITAATIGGSIATAGLAVVVLGFVVALGLLFR